MNPDNIYDDIPEQIEQEDITLMKLYIKKEGNNKTWIDNEKMQDPYERLEWRNIFFKANGTCPKGKEIKI